MEEKLFDIVIAGHLCLDINPGFSGDRSDLETIFIPGKLNIIDKASVSTGGLVANTGLAITRMGLKTVLIGKIADDKFGGLVREVFAEHNAADSLLVSPEETTSYSVNLAVPGRDRIILHCPGCNDTLLPTDIDMEMINKARIFHFGYPQLLKNFYSDNGFNLSSMFRSVQETGVITSLDTAYPDPNSPAGAVNWKDILLKTLPFVKIFAPSIEELFIMLKPSLYEEMSADTGVEGFLKEVDFEYINQLADEILEQGVRIGLVKCGIRGLFLKTGKVNFPGIPDSTQMQWSNRQLWHAAFDAPVVNATGSGDCAVAGFLAAFIRGESPEMALRIASVAGWRNIQTLDTLSGIEDYDTLREDALRNDLPIVEPKLSRKWNPGAGNGIWVGSEDQQ